jgi:hypothetical protein
LRTDWRVRNTRRLTYETLAERARVSWASLAARRSLKDPRRRNRSLAVTAPQGVWRVSELRGESEPMEELLKRVLVNLGGRVDGPFTFRLILQPLVAAMFAIRAGLRDARAGRPAYAWSLCFDRGHSRELLLEGWKDVARVFFAAVIVDVIYEIVVFHWIYPGESLMVAAILALLPYLLIRGVSNRLVGLWRIMTTRVTH